MKMHKELGLKTSPQLIICRLLIWILLIVAVGSFFLAFTDLESISESPADTSQRANIYKNDDLQIVFEEKE